MGYLTPDSIPEDDTCRPLFIPNSTDWLALVSGAISELAKEWNWQQFGSVTPEQAAQRMLTMLNQYYSEDCGGTCTRYRTNPVTLVLEVSFDDGETWQTDTSIPEAPDRPLGETNPDCLAAANAANVIAQLYEATIDAYNTNTAFDFVLSGLAAGMGVAISSLFGAPVAAIIAAGTAVFSLAYQTLDTLFTDYFTPDIQERLTCLILKHTTMTGLKAHVDGAALVYDLRTEFFAGIGQLEIPKSLVWEQIVYLLSILGQDGLDHAAATTAIEVYDCDECDEWSITITPDNYTDYLEEEYPYSVITSCANSPYGSGALYHGGTIGTGYNGETNWITELGTPANLHVLNVRFTLRLPAGTTLTNLTAYMAKLQSFDISLRRVIVNGSQVCNPGQSGFLSQASFTVNQTGGVVQIAVQIASGPPYHGALRFIIITGTGQKPYA